MEFIVVIDLNSNPWRVLNKTFNSCPPSPVLYSSTELREPVHIISSCGQVTIRHQSTGASGTGTAVRIS